MDATTVSSVGIDGIERLTAMVLIPVRAVTVADPPKINMLDTMMLVARLYSVVLEADRQTKNREAYPKNMNMP